MCGIIGYTGGRPAATLLIDGLKRLEYRGYDSSGIAVLDGDKLTTVKTVGKIAELDKKANGGKDVIGTVGIGHTRWATHGVPSDINSHPHVSANGRFAVVHNGIIENYAELKSELIAKGIPFASDTDSEVIAQLVQYLYDGDMLTTLREVCARLVGSYAVGLISTDDCGTLYAARKDNPLVVGLGRNENFIASDFAAALEHTHDFVQLGDGEIARLTPSSVTFYSSNGVRIEKTPFRVDWDISQAEKGGYPHFMLKEIYEQPKALTDTVRPRVKGSSIVLDKIALDARNANLIEKIDIIGCGSAYHAGIVGNRKELPHPRKLRACKRIHLLKPHYRQPHADYNNQSERRNRRHPRRPATRQKIGLAYDSDSQRGGKRNRARGGRRAVYARRT